MKPRPRPRLLRRIEGRAHRGGGTVHADQQIRAAIAIEIADGNAQCRGGSRGSDREGVAREGAIAKAEQHTDLRSPQVSDCHIDVPIAVQVPQNLLRRFA